MNDHGLVRAVMHKEKLCGYGYINNKRVYLVLDAPVSHSTKQINIAMKEAEAKYRAKKATTTTSATVGEVVDLYLNRTEPIGRTMRYDCKRIADRYGSLDAETFNPDNECTDWFYKREAGEWVELMAVASRGKILSTIRTVLRHAVDKEMIRGHKKIKVPAADDTEFYVYSEDERRKILAYAAKHYPNNLYLLAVLMFNSGCRTDEAMKLMVRDIDTVNRLITYRTIKGKARKVRVRQVPINDRLFDVLFMQGVFSLPQDSRVIRSQAGLPFETGPTISSTDPVRTSFAETKEFYSIPTQARLYDMRHTFATQARRNGMPLDMLMKVLGHEDIKTTMIYNHVNTNDAVELFQKIT